MNKKDLITLGVSEEIADQIVVLHGKDIESHKTKITDLQTQFDTAQGQLTDANKQIEDFKGMNVDQIKAAADEWKAKYETAQTESASQLASLKFDHWLDGALATAKAKNPKTVKALLDIDALKKAYDEKTNTVVGFEEHLKPVKSENEYLFDDGKIIPKIVTNTNNKSINLDPFEVGLLKGAKLTPNEEG